MSPHEVGVFVAPYGRDVLGGEPPPMLRTLRVLELGYDCCALACAAAYAAFSKYLFGNRALKKLRPSHTLDELHEEREGRIVATMAVAIENQVGDILMAIEL